MLKRPMCLIGLAVILIVYLLIQVMEVPVLTERAGIQDGQYIYLTGQVSQKEIKQGISVIYLKKVIIQQSSETIQKTSQETYSIIAYLTDNTQVRLGSTIALDGKVSLFDAAENDGQFDAARYYEMNGIDFAVKKAYVTATSKDYDNWRETLYQCRERLKAVYRKLMPEKEAGILHALLLGDKSSLDTEVKELYMRAGIVHILSLSGVKTLKLDIPLVPETRINWAFVPIHIAIIYILKLCLDEEIIPRCRFPCSRGYHKKYINWQKKQ